ncbi:hypothetical protein Q0N88_20215 [Bacillus thuringiensis]|uniref:hypothetical protein n=1 Tax=Bacillus thuringiensis TaxID=1428 RepID=UPI0034577041
MMKKMSVLIAITLMISLAINGLQWSQMNDVKQNLKKETEAKKQAVETISAYKNNKDAIVKNAVEKFLKAFLEVDSTKNENVTEKIKPYTTEKARTQLQVAGDKEQTKTKIKISISELTLYYSATSADKANVIADVKRKTSINEGTAIESQDFVELQLVLKNGKWLVDNTKLIPKLKNE